MNESQQHETRLRPDGLPDAATNLSGILELELEPGQPLSAEQKQKIRETVTRNVKSADPETQKRVLGKMEEWLASVGGMSGDRLAAWSVVNAIRAMSTKLECLRKTCISFGKAADDGRTIFHLGSAYGHLVMAQGALDAGANQIEHVFTCECMGEHEASERPADAPPAEEAL